ncbi:MULTISPECIES: hypothetical protein [Amycolatopsis]|uniref:Uncharacterized protein n=2 Tax=Amycolatopsis TaxID=1813 RepID=A0A1I3Q8B6_9PSEU|nr:hypothetical protein [Amycolatopsis sacchari]SFJ29895.1 hypothetical protein SAMN05421835_104219 [Amycolatopsis sacchari]
MPEDDALERFLRRCREHGIDLQEARRALAHARVVVQSGKVLESDPYRLAWRWLRRRA